MEASGLLKSLFGNEEMNFYIESKPIKTFYAVTKEGVITELGSGELEGQSMNIILKKGVIEVYLNLESKDLSKMIEFCQTKLQAWLKKPNSKAREIKKIINHIVLYK